MKTLSKILMVVVCLVFIFSMFDKVEGCENKVTAKMDATWTDWYDPCGTKLIWQFSYTGCSDGSPYVMIYIQGADVEREIAAGEGGWPNGKVGDTVYFTDGYDHRAMVDFMPSIGIPGFATGTLEIDYFIEQQQ